MTQAIRKLVFIGGLFCTFLSAAQTSDLKASEEYIKQNTQKFHLSREDVKEMALSSSYISPTTGWFHAYYQQKYQGIEVYNSVMNVALKNGHLVHIGSTFEPNLNQILGSNTNFLKSFISPQIAIKAAAKSVNLPVSGTIKEVLNSQTINALGRVVLQKFEAKDISNEEIETKLQWYFPPIDQKVKAEKKAYLTWNVQIKSLATNNVWSIQVNAENGVVLNTRDQVIKCSFGHETHKAENCEMGHKIMENPSHTQRVLAPNTYNVFDIPVESPNHGSRSLVTNPYTKFVNAGQFPGATNGWHHDGTNTYTDTRGNNVHAQEDADNNNTGGSRPTSADLNFDFPYSHAPNTATVNQNASITNLFYWNNTLHDILWKYGFDEPAGNFQVNNMSRGGQGNDPVNADAQDGSGTDNANFYTPSDGNRPRMQMYLWTYTTNYQADSDFDNAIIAHEYGHGWSIRLTGGPNVTDCLQNTEQGGEGWSDYLGLMLTTDWASLTPTVASANLSKGIGTYAIGENTSGLGIRPFPYSYDMANVNPTVKYSSVANTSFSAPHGIGSIWCTMLWDMTWEIIMQDNAIVPNIYNTTELKGNVAALKLVNEGLRLQVCSPSFVDAKDAILAADQALFNGKYKCSIGKAFARRGLGKLANSGSSSNDRYIVEDFTPLNTNLLTSATEVATCSDVNFQYTATSAVSGTVFSWQRVQVPGISNAAATGNTNVISETLINTTPSPITVTYQFKLTPDNCTMVPFQDVKVVVNPKAPSIVNNFYNICQAGTMPVNAGLTVSNGPIILNRTAILNTSSQTFVRPLSGSFYTPSTKTVYYQAFRYQASNAGTVNFDLTSSSDAFLVAYSNTFNPVSPGTNFISASDDYSGTNSRLSIPVSAGQILYLVATTYYQLDIGTFNLVASAGSFVSDYLWFTSNTSNVPIYTGTILNPVGLANSGIANTNVPISLDYFLSENTNQSCRTRATFQVVKATIDPIISGITNSSHTVCDVFNDDSVQVSGQNYPILGWELSTDKFATSRYVNSSSNKLKFKGLTDNTYIRAMQNKGTCLVAVSEPAKINMVKPLILLSDTITANRDSIRANFVLTSTQKIFPTSKVSYQASKNVELNTNFEVATGSTFVAEIKENVCYISVVLDLQPGPGAGVDLDISSAFPSQNFASNKYMIPLSWSQFGTQENRRSLLKFDLQSIPAHAVIDSAFLYLYYSPTMAVENPPFTGHFGDNAFDIKQITGTWDLGTVSWANQPSTTETGKVSVPRAATITQSYPKINVKDMVSAMIVSGNNGFMIKHIDETPYKLTALASSEDPTAALRPRLIVYYRYL